jgi:hypothetical protein
MHISRDPAVVAGISMPVPAPVPVPALRRDGVAAPSLTASTAQGSHDQRVPKSRDSIHQHGAGAYTVLLRCRRIESS